MEVTNIQVRQLTAGDGMMLKKGDFYAKTVYLGKNDSPEYYTEISEEEYQIIVTLEAKGQN